VPHDRNTIAAIGSAVGCRGARHEEKDLRGERTPPSRHPQPHRAQPTARARRRVAPEVRQNAFDPSGPLGAGWKRGKGRFREILRPRDLDPSLDKPNTGPEEESRDRPSGAFFSSNRPADCERGCEQGEQDRLDFALSRPCSQSDSED
jgi:hypothetical protein